MIGVGSALVSLLLIFVCYSLTLTAKRADENLLMICEKNQKNEEERGNREMESQRDFQKKGIGYCISFYSPAGIPFRIKRKIKYIYSKVTRK